MQKKNIPVEFVYQLFALAIAIVIVHSFYVSVVRPTASEIIAEQNLRVEQDDNYVRERSAWVLIKDFEQEACFILMLNALQRFGSTRNVQDVASSTHTICESEADRLESELSMIRYISWAIPSIGFIGTVRGIGEALAQADRAVEGDIAGVTQSLGVAFNSTFVALLISIFLMFLVHQLQLMQERLVFETEAYCDNRLIRHMFAESA